MSSLFRFSQLSSRAAGSFVTTIRRNVGMTAMLLAKADKNTDPIQRLFLEKLATYNQKSKGQGGKLVDSTSDIEAKRVSEMEKIRKRFGGDNLEEFPKFDFK